MNYQKASITSHQTTDLYLPNVTAKERVDHVDICM